MFLRILICNLYQCSIYYINSKRVSVFISILRGVPEGRIKVRRGGMGGGVPLLYVRKKNQNMN